MTLKLHQMRTTLNIEDEALKVIREYARKHGISQGQAVSDLVQRGAENVPKFKMKNGWVILEAAPGTPPLTNELLDQWELEDYDDEYRRVMALLKSSSGQN
jgi:hypothetical protein